MGQRLADARRCPDNDGSFPGLRHDSTAPRGPQHGIVENTADVRVKIRWERFMTGPEVKDAPLAPSPCPLPPPGPLVNWGSIPSPTDRVKLGKYSPPSGKYDWNTTVTGGGTSNGVPYISSCGSTKSSTPCAMGCFGAQNGDFFGIRRCCLPPAAFEMAGAVQDAAKSLGIMRRVQRDKAHSALHGFDHFRRCFVSHFVMPGMAPPEQNVNVRQNFLGDALVRLINVRGFGNDPCPLRLASLRPSAIAPFRLLADKWIWAHGSGLRPRLKRARDFRACHGFFLVR